MSDLEKESQEELGNTKRLLDDTRARLAQMTRKKNEWQMRACELAHQTELHVQPSRQLINVFEGVMQNLHASPTFPGRLDAARAEQGINSASNEGAGAERDVARRPGEKHIRSTGPNETVTEASQT